MSATKTTLVPPRPNLGPEPSTNRPCRGAGSPRLAIAITLLVAWIWRRLLRRPGATGRGPAARPVAFYPTANQDDVVALAETARAALVARFGAPWRARTTEEVAADSGLVEALGAGTVERLVALLRAADRSKFAVESPDLQRDDDAEAWALWVASFVAAAGASSTINGK